MTAKLRTDNFVSSVLMLAYSIVVSYLFWNQLTISHYCQRNYTTTIHSISLLNKDSQNLSSKGQFLTLCILIINFNKTLIFRF